MATLTREVLTEDVLQITGKDSAIKGGVDRR